MEETVLAVDIGATKLEVGLVDGTGAILDRSMTATRGSDGEALFAALAALIRDIDGAGAAALGVGCGGPMRAGGAAVSPLNIPQWRGFPLRERLADRFRRPVFVDNDAKALALGEGWRGAARGVANYLAMVVSSGVGGGIVLDGRLLDGESGNAGHIGHVVVDREGREMAGHVRGVLEAEISGLAIAEITGRTPREAPADLIERCGCLLGSVVGSVANLLDLRLAVVAGSVALGFGDPFFAAAQREVDRVARLDHSLGTVIRPAGLAGDGPLLGAAAVGFRGLGRDPLAEGAGR